MRGKPHHYKSDLQPDVDVSRSVSPKIEKEVNFGVTSNFDPLGLPTETQLHCVWE